MRKKSLDCIYELAKQDSRVVYIGSDVGAETLEQFKKEMPDRFFMEGISEAHIIGMAAGLAKSGYIPYVNTIATFLTRRCYEQIVIDVCLQNLPVKLIANGGGLVYAPLGPTHMAVDDIGLMRLLPNMQIIAPCDAHEMREYMMKTIDIPGPVYVRVGKGDEPNISTEQKRLWKEPNEALIITTGVMIHQALKAIDLLQDKGVTCGLLHLPRIKPIDIDLVLTRIKETRLIITLEEHLRAGGLGSNILEILSDLHHINTPKILRLGLPDHFVELYGSQQELFQHYELDATGISQRVLQCLATINSNALLSL